MPTSHGPFLYFVSVNYELHGQLCQNGFWFIEALPFNDHIDPAVQAQELLLSFKNTVWLKMVAFQNNQVHYKSLVCATVNPHNGPIAEEIIETQTGAQPDESLPSFASSVLSLRTGLGGPSNRGRVFIGGVSENDSSDSRLIPSAFTGLQDIGDELLTRFGPANNTRRYAYGVWSRLRAKVDADGPHPVIDFAFTQVTQCIARQVLGTQKHRQIGHGS